MLVTPHLWLIHLMWKFSGLRDYFLSFVLFTTFSATQEVVTFESLNRYVIHQVPVCLGMTPGVSSSLSYFLTFCFAGEIHIRTTFTVNRYPKQNKILNIVKDNDQAELGIEP